MSPVLERAAVGIVVVLAIAGALNYYRHADENPWYADMGPERFQSVMTMVPAEAVIGYVSDLPDLFSGDSFNPASRLGAIWSAAAWYALAPRLVVPHGNPQKQDWILGNFYDPVDLAQVEMENRLKLVRDFGSGLVLFQCR